jgi:sugar phosphate isomerase/epimerase
MRVATMTSLFREQRGKQDHINYIESIKRCKAAGFNALDFNMCAMIHNKTELNGDDWLKQADLIREEAEKLGVVFSQSHPPYRPGMQGTFSTKEEEDFFAEITRRSIIVSSILGVKWAVMHPVTECENIEYDLDANLAHNHRIFDEFVELALKENVGIAFENMADRDLRRRFGTTTSELIALTNSYKDKNIGVCWDTGHGNRVYQDPVRPIRELGSRIKALHVNDNHGNTDEHLLPFEGNLKWEEIMKVLKEVGYEGDLVYEIRLNNNMPDALKDISAQYAAEVGRYLLSLCE